MTSGETLLITLQTRIYVSLSMARNYDFKVRATRRRQRDNKVCFDHCFDVFQMFSVQVFEGIHPEGPKYPVLWMNKRH